MRTSNTLLPILLFICMSITAASNAQPTVPDEARVEQPGTEQDKLQQCLKDKQSLAGLLTSTSGQGKTTKHDLQQNAQKLRECRDDVALSRKTNLGLVRKLDQCKERPTCEPEQESKNEAQIRELEEQVQLLLDQATKSQKDFDKALNRLAKNNLSLEPVFSFYSGDTYQSFVDGKTMEQVNAQSTGSARLLAKHCENALKWLGDREFVRKKIWVWQDGRPVLCKPAADGGHILKKAKSRDEAHLIFFK